MGGDESSTFEIYRRVGWWGTMGSSRWVGGKSFKRKKKKRAGGGEKIKLQKKTEIRAEKGQTKKNEAGMAQG
jgi:hypothetical protein